MDITYRIEGMHCGGCARRIEQAASLYAASAHVDFESASLRLSDPKIECAELQSKIASLGEYRISLDHQADAKTSDDPNLALTTRSSVKTYYPLILIAAYVGVASCAATHSTNDWMLNFMAGFFLVFSFFKLLDLPRFASSYAMYDVLAGCWRPYGFLYPFCELALGLAYLFRWRLQFTLWVTLALMLFGAAGVLRALKRKDNIRCACLGAIIDLPVSSITLIEDVGMAAMAALGLLAIGA